MVTLEELVELERTYEFAVREAPKSNNAGGGGTRANKYAAAREKGKWEGLFLKELMVLKAEPFMSYCVADISVHFKRRNHRDEENYRQAVVKPLADALQKGGYLKDDTAEWFKVRSFQLVEGELPWPAIELRGLSPLVTAYTHVRLEATYD